MPKRYVRQMIADWKAMGRWFGDTPQEYYEKTKANMKLHYHTIKMVEKILREV